MDIFMLLAGIVILLVGRQIFWLVVAITGAVIGGEEAPIYFPSQSPWIQVAAVILGALVGALLAVFLQPLAAALLGFYAGGAVVHDLALRWGLVPQGTDWLPTLIGGITGAVVMLLVFNWALIVLSSLYGATLIIQNLGGLHIDASAQKILFAVLVAVGIIVQAFSYRRNPPAV